MNLQQWWSWYSQIVQKLNLNPEKDWEATLVLSKMLRGKTSPLVLLRERLRGRSVLIFGAGPSLEKDLKNIASVNLQKYLVSIAADGATTALMEVGIKPNIIVTDLDGRIEDIIEANKHGSAVIIHAHGDNIDALKAYVPQFSKPLYGTTQNRPLQKVYNFGGFTDGDRCVFLSEKFGASKIVMAGMDLGVKIGKYSKPNLKEDVAASTFKQRKLRIAEQLLIWLSTWSRADISNLTFSGKEIKGIRRIAVNQLSSLI